MGLLYEKYASPNELINRMIKTRNFKKFCMNLVSKKNEEAEERKLWELYLHHPFLDKSFNEFKDQCGITTPTPKVNEKPVDMVQTVAQTIDIFQGFNPEEE